MRGYRVSRVPTRGDHSNYAGLSNLETGYVTDTPEPGIAGLNEAPRFLMATLHQSFAVDSEQVVPERCLRMDTDEDRIG